MGFQRFLSLSQHPPLTRTDLIKLTQLQTYVSLRLGISRDAVKALVLLEQNIIFSLKEKGEKR